MVNEQIFLRKRLYCQIITIKTRITYFILYFNYSNLFYYLQNGIHKQNLISN